MFKMFSNWKKHAPQVRRKREYLRQRAEEARADEEAAGGSQSQVRIVLSFYFMYFLGIKLIEGV